MLEAFRLQQYSVVNLCMLACRLYASLKARSANNLYKGTIRFPRVTQSLFILSIPPTWRHDVSMTYMTSLHLTYDTPITTVFNVVAIVYFKRCAAL